MEHRQLYTMQFTSVSQKQEIEGEESTRHYTESRGGDQAAPMFSADSPITCCSMCQERRHITRNQMSGKRHLLELLEKLQRWHSKRTGS